MDLGALSTRRFRANARYELVLFDRLPAVERARFATLAQDPDFYGVWCPRDGAGTAKAVTRDIALLVLTLGEAGALPRYFLEAIRGEELDVVRQLVLDEVLAIEDDEGAFVSGPRGRLVFGRADPGEGSVAAEHPLLRLSMDAVRYGASLPLDDPLELSLRLYQFHRLPRDGAWVTRLEGPPALLRWLGVASGTATSRALDRDYVPVRGGPTQRRWQFWRGRAARLRSATTHKLYISPLPEAMPEVFRVAVTELAAHRVAAFKVGNDAGGVLRPDKFVAYAASRRQLDDLVGALGRRLSGTPAHGVPFTAPVGDGTLLSWGMDPPASGALSPWRRASWRLYVTDRLGAALAAAHRTPGIPPADFALERLAMQGVDVSRWCPSGGSWAGAGEAAGAS